MQQPSVNMTNSCQFVTIAFIYFKQEALLDLGASLDFPIFCIHICSVYPQSNAFPLYHVCTKFCASFQSVPSGNTNLSAYLLLYSQGVISVYCYIDVTENMHT